MKTKYDWSGVPFEVNFIAMDSDGETWGYSEEPRKGVFSHYLKEDTFMYFIGNRLHKGNWQDSLEERPNDL